MQTHVPVDFKGATFSQVEACVAHLGERSFRARQVYRWVFQHDAAAFSEMTNLPAASREKLEQTCIISRLQLDRLHTASDGTRKFLFRVGGGERVESVLIPGNRRQTLCLSTQVGCRLACAFCRTGEGGLTRNLEPAEIVDQYLGVQRELRQAMGPEVDVNITNLVLMGMGEPLDNYENVVAALRILTAAEGLQVSPRRITLSTAGLAPRLEQFAREGIPVKLAVSLNASTDEQRQRLMPINRAYNLARLIQTCRAYPLARRDRITFEYVLLGGINDGPEDAQRLSRLVRGIRCKINLIPFNEFSTSPFKKPAADRLRRFAEILLADHLTVTVRESRGQDIYAACGQLRTNEVHEAENVPAAINL